MGKNDRVLSKGGGRRAAAASALPAPGLGLAPEPAVTDGTTNRGAWRA